MNKMRVLLKFDTFASLEPCILPFPRAHHKRESNESCFQLWIEDEKAKHERDTAQGDDITYELEKERIRLKQDLDAEVAEKQKLEVALKESLNTLEEEKSKQKQIVLVLLADRKKLMKLYLEEKKRSEDLAGMLQERVATKIRRSFGRAL